ncbi:MAG: nickel pincer cofactor biosynthesis protein LarB [Brucellaceae bacterium]|nr:nickel pincer cofactor biosynthesis protein LarB [Brucellaceae bacterium]
MDFTIDWERFERTGVPEAVMCSNKSAAQIAAIAAEARADGRRLLFTRLDDGLYSSLDAATRKALRHDPLSRTAVLGGEIALQDSGIGIVCAGTSDLPVAREAQSALAFSGARAGLIADIGVAGLWRLTAHLEDIRAFSVIIAVAGMEGALFSVLAGLVSAPVIAVPTSVGYGVAEGGHVALNSALASCAPGIVVVNIDNGFGAAAAALKILAVR